MQTHGVWGSGWSLPGEEASPVEEVGSTEELGREGEGEAREGR